MTPAIASEVKPKVKSDGYNFSISDIGYLRLRTMGVDTRVEFTDYWIYSPWSDENYLMVYDLTYELRTDLNIFVPKEMPDPEITDSIGGWSQFSFVYQGCSECGQRGFGVAISAARGSDGVLRGDTRYSFRETGTITSAIYFGRGIFNLQLNCEPGDWGFGVKTTCDSEFVVTGISFRNAPDNFVFNTFSGVNLSRGYDLSRIAAIPEPRTWMLMISGFFATGFAMRRRVVGLDSIK